MDIMRNNLNITPDHVVCPNCFELLTRDDIEGFGRCPYCDHGFDLDEELEDFLLKPVIEEWVRFTRSRDDMDMMM
jgi:hypothetical protein